METYMSIMIQNLRKTYPSAQRELLVECFDRFLKALDEEEANIERAKYLLSRKGYSVSKTEQERSYVSPEISR
jgi:hypothetical protein